MIRDIIADVLQRHKADISDAKSKIKELSREEQKAAKERVKAQDDVNTSIERGMQKYALAAAGLAAGIAVARSGLNALRQDARLASGSAGIDIGKLGAAYDGLRSKTELMTIAQAGARGAWKLNTDQLEDVIGGMRALEKQGFETVDITNKITDALKKGKAEGLDDFGISLKSTGDKTKDLAAFLAAMREEVREVGGDFAMAGDEVTRAAVKMEDGIGRLKVAIGQATLAVIDFAEAAGRGLAIQIGGLSGEDQEIADANAARQRGIDRIRFRNRKGGQLADAGWAEGVYYQEQAQRSLIRTGAFDKYGPTHLQEKKDRIRFDSLAEGDALRKALDAAIERSVIDQLEKALINPFKASGAGAGKKRGPRPPRGRGASDSDPGEFLGGVWGEGGEGLWTAWAGISGAYRSARETERSYEAGSAYSTGDGSPFSNGLDEHRQQIADKKSRLEVIFGPVSDFDRYKEAWQGLESVVSAGFDAWITGSKSAGAAMKEALSGYAKNLAGEALLQALRHGAYAIGSLALGDPRAAATHGVAAAKWGAVAVAAGVYAKATSPGAAGTANANAAAGIGGSRGGGQDATPLGATFVFGDGFADDSPLYRARRVRRAINLARDRFPDSGATERG